MSSNKPLIPPGVANNPRWQEEFIENYWLGLGDTAGIETGDPFLEYAGSSENPALRILGLMRDPRFFSFSADKLFSIRLAPFQLAILNVLWNHAFPMIIGCRGFGKSYLIAVYVMLRAIFCPGVKIVIVGAAFRQAKVIFDYCQGIWDASPVLRDFYGNDKRNGPRRDVDRCSLRLGESLIICVPLGTGEKIRGLRANVIVADEMPFIPIDIFETVVRGFASVSSDPVGKMQDEAKREAIKALGLWTTEYDAELEGLTSNQVICAGSAYYAFNHFADYWKRYRSIIRSKGDPQKLEEIFGPNSDAVSWKDYAVVRMPVEALPPKFMDEKQIAHARATVNKSVYLCEYAAVFCSDSDGFYKRSLIESCVVGKPANPISHPSCENINFNAVLRGDPNKRYVIAVDPASEKDNLAIFVLEAWSDHRRIVYGWTTTRSRHKAILKAGLTEEQDYYHFSARKIRDLIKLFPCERLAMDSQGGGVAIMEALQDTKNLQPGERPIYPIINSDKPLDTDGMSGDHILELINFAQAQWVAEANHGMRKDLEDKVLLFPNFDPAVIAVALEEDKATGRVKVSLDGQLEKLYDTLEDCVMEIEELKDELSSIVHTQTGQTLRDRWDVPEVKQPGGKKGRLRKDRYSALLMANMVARVMERTPDPQEYSPYGGFASAMNVKPEGLNGPMWIGPAWYTEAVASPMSYGLAVQRS